MATPLNPPGGGPPAPLPAASPTPAERERAVELLSRHYAVDRLTDSDLQARLDRVYLATTPSVCRRCSWTCRRCRSSGRTCR